MGNVNNKIIAKQCKIVSDSTITDWASFCREVCFDKMVVKAAPIGGPGKIVELEESKFGKRNCNRGHRVEGQWFFRGVERDTGKCFMVPVETRNRATPIIKNWILPGTTIISDCL